MAFKADLGLDSYLELASSKKIRFCHAEVPPRSPDKARAVDNLTCMQPYIYGDFYAVHVFIEIAEKYM